MAMSSLNINYEATRTAGKSVQNQAGEFKSLLKDIIVETIFISLLSIRMDWLWEITASS